MLPERLKACAPCSPACSDGIVGWVKKKTGPPAITVDSTDKLKEVEADNAVIVVGYFEKLEVGKDRLFRTLTDDNTLLTL